MIVHSTCGRRSRLVLLVSLVTGSFNAPLVGDLVAAAFAAGPGDATVRAPQCRGLQRLVIYNGPMGASPWRGCLWTTSIRCRFVTKAGAWDQSHPPEEAVRRVDLYWVEEKTMPPGEPPRVTQVLLHHERIRSQGPFLDALEETLKQTDS